MNQAERAIRKHLFFHWIAMFIPAIASIIGLQMFTDLNAWGFVSELNIPFRVVVCLSWISSILYSTSKMRFALQMVINLSAILLAVYNTACATITTVFFTFVGLSSDWAILILAFWLCTLSFAAYAYCCVRILLDIIKIKRMRMCEPEP